MATGKRDDSGTGDTPSNPTYLDSAFPTAQAEVMDDTQEWIDCTVEGDPAGRQNDDISYEGQGESNE